MMLQYRFAQPDDIAEVAGLVAHSFPGPPRTPAWWHEQLADPAYGGGHQTLFIGQSEGRTVAALQLHPLREWIAGKLISVAGVGTVAVSPTYRKRRLGSELVTAAVQAARERGDVASALYAFRTSFYQKQGYGQAGEALQHQVPTSSLPDSKERLRVELVDSEKGRAEILELYNRWAQKQNGQVERNARLWAETTGAADRVLVVYRAPGGGAEGYCLAIYRTDVPRRDRFLEVDELVWTTDRSRRGLYGWLGSMGDQWDQVLIRSLASHRLADWLREPRLPHGAAPLWGLWTPGATLMNGPMFRLLDVRAAWNGRAINTERATSGASAFPAFSLDVTDAQIAENAGSWLLSLEGPEATLERSSASSSGVPRIRLDISVLSRLFIGSLAPTSALSAGLLECDQPAALAALDAALATAEPWTFDRF